MWKTYLESNWMHDFCPSLCKIKHLKFLDIDSISSTDTRNKVGFLSPTLQFYGLPIQILNPPDGFRVADFSEVPIGGRKVCVAEDHF